MLKISAIPAFSDNYIWCIYNDQSKQAIIVDPGSAQAVEDFLSENQLELEAILITHHHPDHVGGVNHLKKTYSSKVIGFKHAKLSFIDHAVTQGDEIKLLDSHFQVLEVPGHTLDHIAYFSPASTNESQNQHTQPWLFCGDTLFSGGCGRLFEGTPEQMHSSLAKFSALPKDTEIYCAHEYTLSNLDFAKSLMPNNSDLQDYAEHCAALREQLKPTIPSTLDIELKINPFLRMGDKSLIDKLKLENYSSETTPEEIFAAVRKAKDTF